MSDLDYQLSTRPFLYIYRQKFIMPGFRHDVTTVGFSGVQTIRPYRAPIHIKGLHILRRICLVLLVIFRLCCIIEVSVLYPVEFHGKT